MTQPIASIIGQYVVDTWLSGDSRDFDELTDLQTSGILDSFSIFALATFIDETFQVRLDPIDINAETFRTVRSISMLVSQRLDRPAHADSST